MIQTNAKALPVGQRFFARQVVAHNIYVARPRYEHTVEDVLRPEYWRHSCSMLRSDDIIEVMPEGMEWYARLVVIQADQYTAKVKLLQHTVLTDQPDRKEKASSFKTDRNGAWWRVIRISDQNVMKNGLRGEAEALAWIAENCEA